jgi:lysophospholipase L1-like esterase
VSKRRVFLTMVMALIVVAQPLAAVAASPEEAVYLSLGDSLAAGTLADADGNSIDFSDQSYTDELFQRIGGRIAADLTHVKLGCPGETTDRLMGVEPSVCAADYVTGSQLGDALATLAEGNVVLITIGIGANDITRALGICGFNDPVCIGAQIQSTAGKVAQIVGTLRQVGGYTGPIVGMNYYNPFVAAAIGFFSGVPGQQAPNQGLAVLSDALARAFNGALAQAYAATGAEVADVYTAFGAGNFTDQSPMNGIADNVDVLCKLSYMCPDDPDAMANRHLNPKGYRVVAKTFIGVIAGIEFDK